MDTIKYNQFLFRDLEIDDENSLLKLFRQLIQHEALLNVEECLKVENMHCIVIECCEEIVGFGAVIYDYSPTKGYFARLEDIVVKDKYRGLGLGKELVRLLIAKAVANNIKLITLTSNPTRVVARSLYLSMGFSKRDTDVFELKIS